MTALDKKRVVLMVRAGQPTVGKPPLKNACGLAQATGHAG